MKVNYSLKYIKNSDSSATLDECFKRGIAVVGKKDFEKYVFSAKGDVWLKGFYKGIGFGRKMAKLISIVINLLDSKDFKVKDINFYVFSGEPPFTAMSVTIIENDTPAPEIDFDDEIIQGKCEFEVIRIVKKEELLSEINAEKSKIFVGKLNSKVYKTILIGNVCKSNYCKIYALGIHVEKVPLILMMKKFPIKISKITFFNMKNDSDKFPVVSGIKVVVVRGDVCEV